MTQKAAGRYSKALFNLASSKQELEQQLSDLEQVVGLLDPLMPFFYSPQISQKEKEAVLDKNLKGRFDDKLLSFLLFLLKKRRLKDLSDIVQDYRRLVREELGVLEVRVVTAVPLDRDIKEKLQVKLEKVYPKKIEIQEEVDPELIGGGMVIMGNQLIDFSIRDKLARLKESLLSTKETECQ
jgi:F-type H+-transporting ATPase subunit delta